MDWDELFGGIDKGVNKEEQKWMFLNALLVAGIDGTIDSAEIIMLRNIQEKLGLNQKEIEEIKSNPRNVKFEPPKTKEERFAHLVDLVFVMLANGVADPRESILVKNIAKILGFDPNLVPIIVLKITEAIRANQSRANIINKISKFRFD